MEKVFDQRTEERTVHEPQGCCRVEPGDEEIVAVTLMRNQVTVGVAGLTVQLDETVYSKRKYNQWRSYPQQWVFGGVCLEAGDCFMMPDRSSATLISAIRQNATSLP
uniref:Uncharacterized protein n=1 Tax=Trichuris muris TaxID=70415 RepID=A0A5S6QWW7_TRIMR